MEWLINKAFLTPSVEQLLRLQADSWTSKTIRRISFLFLLSYPPHQISLQLPAEWKQVHNFWQLGRLGWFFGMSGYRKVGLDSDHDGIYDVIGYLIKLCIIWT